MYDYSNLIFIVYTIQGIEDNFQQLLPHVTVV